MDYYYLGAFVRDFRSLCILPRGIMTGLQAPTVYGGSMDFLTLFVCYVLTSVVVVVAYLAEDSPLLTTGRIGRCRSFIYRNLVWISQKLPTPIWRGLTSLYDKVFYQRNAVFQLLYVLMVVAGHLVLMVDALPYLYAVQPEVDHLCMPALLLGINTALFLLCCYSDAGVITKDNVDRYQRIYEPDGILYKPESTCPTCLLAKPARSKHCAISDRCYFKFDHYCAWTNNCVAGLNHRWFMLFIVSVIAMCINAAVMSVMSLAHVTNLYQLMNLRYLDSSGQAQPMNLRVLIQTLFMQLPRLVFLAASLAVIALFMSGFMIYHLYLVVTNQTTNERYKCYNLRKSHNTQLLCYPFSKGIVGNLLEEVFPLWCYKRQPEEVSLANGGQEPRLEKKKR